MNIRGLSSVIIIVVFVALSLMAVGVSWAVISNIISENTESISSSMENLKINAAIKNVDIKGNNISILVKRFQGGENTNLSLIIKNDIEETIKNIGNINEREVKNIKIPKPELGFIFQEISLVIIEENEIKKVLDSKKFSLGESLSLFGAISYLPLEKNFKDYSKKNMEWERKNGNAAPENFLNLSNSRTYIEYSDSSHLNMNYGNFTIMGWVKLNQDNENWQFIFGKKGIPYGAKGYAMYRKKGKNKLSLHLANHTNNHCRECYSYSDTKELNLNKWHHITMTRNLSNNDNGYYYLNGTKEEFSKNVFGGNVSSPHNFSIGRNSIGGNYYFNGGVNGIIIFPRVLEDFEVRSIYQLTKKGK